MRFGARPRHRSAVSCACVRNRFTEHAHTLHAERERGSPGSAARMLSTWVAPHTFAINEPPLAGRSVGWHADVADFRVTTYLTKGGQLIEKDQREG